jgi:serine protease
MSLGGSGSCGSQYQSAINDLVAANVAVVVAAGNDSGHAVNSPANCTGAIGVAGVRHAGTKVGYSNVGPQIAVAAPAGNCINTDDGTPCLYPLMTTVNLGNSSVGANGYSDSYNRPSLGTSFAAPLVAGTVALMRSLLPTMTPTQIKTALQASARPFPSTGGTDNTVVACHAPNGQDQLECYCTTSTCGAGLLDTAGAVGQVQQIVLQPTASIAASSTTVTVGQTVTLDGSASSASAGRSITGYAWSITGGATLASFAGATNGVTAALQTSAAGSVTVSLTVTDSTGASRSTSSTITVAAAPVTATPAPPATGGGGGGALGLGWLAGLAAAVLALALARQRA